MMKQALLACGLVAALSIAGCSGGESDMNKKETDALRNPSKTISPEAAAGMAKMGDLMKQQAEANKAAGVDSRGIPISKSGGADAGGPPPEATKAGGQ
jgi:hypothetical protein